MKKQKKGLTSFTYTTVKGQTVELDMLDGSEIYTWYREACTADYILNNPKFYGIKEESEAWQVSSIANEILDDYYYTGEDEDAAICQAIKKIAKYRKEA